MKTSFILFVNETLIKTLYRAIAAVDHRAAQSATPLRSQQSVGSRLPTNVCNPWKDIYTRPGILEDHYSLNARRSFKRIRAPNAKPNVNSLVPKI